MLEYIKSQIRAQNAGSVAPASTPEEVPDDVITEYAQLFQELDDITVEGSEVGKERKLGVDIPLEDDVEVESIEISLDGARVLDVAGDTAAPSTVGESYETMKTYDQFFIEAATKVARMPRESDESYEKRVSVLAEQMYNEYCTDAEEIGAFGFGKMDLTDDRVPSKINVDFGPMKKGSDKSFMAKVRTFFATDDEHKITKKQLDSVRLVQGGAFAKIGEPLMAYMESHYGVSAESSVWDVCTPKNLIVPKGNGDSFCVVLEYTNELTGKSEFYGWTRPVTTGSIENSIVQESFDLDAEADKWIKTKPEVKSAIEKGIDDQFKSLMGSFKPTEEELENNRKKIMSKSMPASALMSLYAKSYFDKLLDAQTKAFQDELMSDANAKMEAMKKKIMERRSKNSTTQESFDIAECERVNMESFVNETQYENKDLYIQESVTAAQEERVAKRRPLSRFYQEAIDFGNGDAGSDTTPAADNGGTDAPPPIDNGGGDQSGDQNVDSGNSTDASSTDTQQPTTDNADKETAAVNNVSAEIAEKVADTTQAEATGDTTDSNNDEMITFDDEDNSGSSDDGMSDMATPDETASVDDQLDDLDNTDGGDDLGDDMGSEDMSGDMDFDGDIENMSMEDIMSNASEKLKSMPLGELRKFLNENTDGTAVQEAFILTKKNINKEVDINLRKCLGVLNDNKMDIDKLVKKFKFDGHKLNRVLSKAAKMGKVYSSDEQEAIKQLNSCLGELMVSLKKSNDSSYVSSVKRKIEAFIKQSKIVAAFVEDKMNAGTVQEGFTQEAFLIGNIEGKITKALIPVKGDLAEISRLHKEGRLTRGKLVRKYRASGRIGGGENSAGTPTGGTNTGTLSAKHGAFTGITSCAHDMNTALKYINKALKKKASGISEDKMEIIANLGDSIDLISDYIETILDTSSNQDEMIKRVGILAGEIVEMIDQFIGDSEFNETPTDGEELNESETTDTPEEGSVDDEPIDSDNATDTDDGEEDDE